MCFACLLTCDSVEFFFPKRHRNSPAHYVSYPYSRMRDTSLDVTKHHPSMKCGNRIASIIEYVANWIQHGSSTHLSDNENYSGKCLRAKSQGERDGSFPPNCLKRVHISIHNIVKLHNSCRTANRSALDVWNLICRQGNTARRNCI